MEFTEIVLKTISGKPMKAGEIDEKAGVEKSDIEKAIKKLKKEEKIWSPKVCFYDVR
ncbi:MAG: MarR family transcriptional regulator [Bacteroidales bacterium]|nr:MarR family transcriptional regulator [Bacteroidales bacterium]